MIWQSTLLMTLIDLLILGAIGYALGDFLSARKRLTTPKMRYGSVASILGLSLIAVFSLIDLQTMHFLPQFMDMPSVISVMQDFHLDYVWTVAVFGICAIALGHAVANQGAFALIDELEKSKTRLMQEVAVRKRVEQVRTELEQELRHMQKMDSLGTLAGGIAHEINTPVQYVAENLRFLEDSFLELGKVSQQFGRLIEAASADVSPVDMIGESNAANADTDYLCEEIPASIRQSLEGIEQIGEIVRAIKEFSHPDAKEKSAIDINRAIETTLTVARNQWKYVADVETDFDDTLPPVLCQPGEFNQVLLNLIVNAAHAISERGAEEKGRITLSTRMNADRVEVRISDTGVGIPAENREKIFDPFFTTKDPGKGTGQGLAIAYTIITKKHKGTISLHSELGKGTTFTVSLPLGLEGSSDAAA